MENLNIQPGNQTPSIVCDAVKGMIEIKGKSIPEDPYDEVFKPLMDWIKEYASDTPEMTTVHVELEYFNTSSSKYLLDTFRMLEKIHHNAEEASVNINWYYEEDDEDMLEAGQDYQAIIKIPFEMRVI